MLDVSHIKSDLEVDSEFSIKKVRKLKKERVKFNVYLPSSAPLVGSARQARVPKLVSQVALVQVEFFLHASLVTVLYLTTGKQNEFCVWL